MFAKQFLSNLEHRVFGKLEDEGWFYDAAEREIETSFLPWLTQSVASNIDKMQRTRNTVDELVCRSEVLKGGVGPLS